MELAGGGVYRVFPCADFIRVGCSRGARRPKRLAKPCWSETESSSTAQVRHIVHRTIPMLRTVLRLACSQRCCTRHAQGTLFDFFWVSISRLAYSESFMVAHGRFQKLDQPHPTTVFQDWMTGLCLNHGMESMLAFAVMCLAGNSQCGIGLCQLIGDATRFEKPNHSKRTSSRLPGKPGKQVAEVTKWLHATSASLAAGCGRSRRLGRQLQADRSSCPRQAGLRNLLAHTQS